MYSMKPKTSLSVLASNAFLWIVGLLVLLIRVS
jgi:hypothetical protein